MHISTMNMVRNFMSRRTQEHKIPGSTEGILWSAYAAKRKNYLQLNTALNEKKVTPVKGYPSKLSYWISTRETFVSVNFCVNQKLWLPRYNQCVLITDTSIVCLAWAVDWLSAPGCLDVVSDLPSQTVYRVPTLQCSGIETCYNTRLA